MILKSIAGFVNFLLKRNDEITKMNPLETQEAAKDIYAIKTKYANFYAVRNGDEYIAIDAGGSKNIAKSELGKLSIKPEKVTAILLTHTDFDHIAALGLFKNAAVYISKEEVRMIDGSTVRMFGFKNKLNCEYKTLSDNEEVNLGKLKVKAMLTPGHTNGSMSFILNDRYLFTGDTLSLQNGKVKLFNSSFNMDDNAQETSIKSLAKLQNIEYIFTAHYGFSDDFHEAFKNFL